MSRYAEFDWYHACGLNCVAPERLPTVGDTFTWRNEQWRVIGTYGCLGEWRMQARAVDDGRRAQTFERVARDAWRAFNQSETFSLWS